MTLPAIVSRDTEHRLERIAEKRLLLEERQLDHALRQLERDEPGRGCCCCWVPLLVFVPFIVIARWMVRKLKKWLAIR